MSRIRSLAEFMFFGIPLKSMSFYDSQLETVDIFEVDQGEINSVTPSQNSVNKSIPLISYALIGSFILCLLTYTWLLLWHVETPCFLENIMLSLLAAFTGVALGAESSRPI